MPLIGKGEYEAESQLKSLSKHIKKSEMVDMRTICNMTIGSFAVDKLV